MLDIIFTKIIKFIPVQWRSILSHEGFKRYFKNTGWMFLGQIFSLLMSFIVGIWIARYLGPKNYGVLNCAISFAGLFGFISTLGIDAVLNRELVRSPERRDSLLGTGFYFKLGGGLLAFISAIVAISLTNADYLVKTLVLAFSFSFIFQAINVISIFFQAEVKAKKNVQAQLIATLISSVLKVIVIVTGRGVFWLVLIYALDSAWQGLILLRLYQNTGLRIKQWKLDRLLARQLWTSAWPLMLSGAAIFIYTRIDQVMVEYFLGTKAVGYYAVAVKLTEVWGIIPGVVCASLFPAIINAKKTDAESYRRRLKNLYILLISAALIIALIMTGLAPYLIRLLFGADYLPSIGLLQIYVWSNIGLFWGWALSQYLMSENLSRIIFIVNFTAMLLNIALNLILIPWIGLNGAAIATLISYSIIPALVFGLRRYAPHQFS